jgi:hypothetical protein
MSQTSEGIQPQASGGSDPSLALVSGPIATAISAVKNLAKIPFTKELMLKTANFLTKMTQKVNAFPGFSEERKRKLQNTFKLF